MSERCHSMTRTGRPRLPDREAVRAAAIGRFVEIARHVWAGDRVERRAGASLRFGARGARVVHLQGRLAGRYADWEAGHHGDVFDLWAREELGLGNAAADFPAVLRDLAGFLGVDAAVPGAGVAERPPIARARARGDAQNTLERTMDGCQHDKDRADRLAIAQMIGASEPLPGSPGMAYLRARGITRTVGAPDLRFLPPGRLERTALEGLYRRIGAGPPPWLDRAAILCLARDGAGAVTGLQRILLDRTGRHAARTAVRKPSTGRLTGAALHLPARADAIITGTSPPLLLAEGPETALALWQATGLEIRAALGGFGSGLPPGDRDRLHLVCHDVDPTGSASETARLRLHEDLATAGYAVRAVAPPGPSEPGRDFNDVLTKPGEGDAAIRSAILAALDPAAFDPGD